MAVWGHAETLKFIELWGEESIQNMLEGCKRNKDVFSKLSSQMEASGFKKTGEQCSSKIKKLRLEYKTSEERQEKKAKLDGSFLKRWILC